MQSDQVELRAIEVDGAFEIGAAFEIGNRQRSRWIPTRYYRRPE